MYSERGAVELIYTNEKMLIYFVYFSLSYELARNLLLYK